MVMLPGILLLTLS